MAAGAREVAAAAARGTTAVGGAAVGAKGLVAALAVLGPPAADAPRVGLTQGGGGGGGGSSGACVAGKNKPHESSPLLGWRRSNLRGRGEFEKLGR